MFSTNLAVRGKFGRGIAGFAVRGKWLSLSYIVLFVDVVREVFRGNSNLTKTIKGKSFLKRN